MLKEVSIEIIRRCPNHCLHCSSMSDESCKEILDVNCFAAIVGDAAKLGAKTICLSGGEPFLHHEIADMIELIAAAGLQSYVYTSGIAFDKYNNRASLDQDILKAISKHVTKLIFNIEAAKPSTYDEIMGTEGCFEKMKQSIASAHKFSIITEAHFVPMKLNANEAEDVIALCKDLNVSKVSFLRLVSHGRALHNESRIAMTADELAEFKIRLKALKTKSEIDVRIGVPLSADPFCHKCEAAQGKLNIKYDGYVFPCEVFKNDRISQCLREMRPESIYDKSLLDIYNHSPYLNLIRELSQRFSGNGHCETCIGQYLMNNEDDDDEQ